MLAAASIHPLVCMYLSRALKDILGCKWSKEMNVKICNLFSGYVGRVQI